MRLKQDRTGQKSRYHDGAYPAGRPAVAKGTMERRAIIQPTRAGDRRGLGLGQPVEDVVQGVTRLAVYPDLVV